MKLVVLSQTTQVCVKSCVNLKHFKQEKPSANLVQEDHITERLSNNESNGIYNKLERPESNYVNWRSVQYQLISILNLTLCKMFLDDKYMTQIQ
jgi:hypothetical protein